MNDFQIEILSGEKDQKKLEQYMPQIYDLHCRTIGAPPYDCPLSQHEFIGKSLFSLVNGFVVLLVSHEDIIGYAAGNTKPMYDFLKEVACKDYSVNADILCYMNGLYVSPEYQRLGFGKTLSFIRAFIFYKMGFSFIMGYTKYFGDQISINNKLGNIVGESIYQIGGLRGNKRLLFNSLRNILDKGYDINNINMSIDLSNVIYRKKITKQCKNSVELSF